MRVFDQLAGFAGAAFALLEEEEEKHNLPLGVLTRLMKDGAPEEKCFFAVIEESDGASAVLIMTPRRNMIMAPTRLCSSESLRYAVEALLGDQIGIPGIIGLLPYSEKFAAHHTEMTGCRAVLSMRQRIYSLSAVRSAADVAGNIRRADEGDICTVSDWLARFAEEATPDQSPPVVQEMARRLISRQSIYLWVDGEPVSMAAQTRRLRNTAAVNFVFTPEEKRRRGYATACVRALSRLLLEKYDRCVLYADLANPASNTIYRKIGYEPVSDSAVFRFVSGDSRCDAGLQTSC